MSSTTMNSFCVALLCTLVLFQSSCHVTFAGRAIPSSAPSTVVRPLAAEGDEGDYASLRPRLDRDGKPVSGGGGREFKGCLPKGFRRASAPSRFVNFHTLRSGGGCNSSGVSVKKP